MPPCHYETLGVAPTASPEDVRSAYRALAQRWVCARRATGCAAGDDGVRAASRSRRRRRRAVQAHQRGIRDPVQQCGPRKVRRDAARDGEHEPRLQPVHVGVLGLQQRVGALPQPLPVPRRRRRYPRQPALLDQLGRDGARAADLWRGLRRADAALPHARGQGSAAAHPARRGRADRVGAGVVRSAARLARGCCARRASDRATTHVFGRAGGCTGGAAATRAQARRVLYAVGAGAVGRPRAGRGCRRSRCRTARCKSERHRRGERGDGGRRAERGDGGECSIAIAEHSRLNRCSCAADTHVDRCIIARWPAALLTAAPRRRSARSGAAARPA
eukprot:Unigene11288_Nuclearia_a/m.34484 Unigene11288_Nuclearia_a/g.34484  ORF Unigene11288_Nuclearia_a/g.34484 Unigene11288_Nuclearia_a/m.34484 type:complete len:332 (-) Unigene11288_Nuclearia_a:1047-2042(-)